MPDTKTCITCKKEKDINKFYLKTAPNGLKYRSRKCGECVYEIKKGGVTTVSIKDDFIVCYECKAKKENKCFSFDPAQVKTYKPRCRECINNKARNEYRTNDGWAKEVLAQAKKRSKVRGYDFNLDISDIPIPEFCPVLGLKLEIGVAGKLPQSPTLDRIDSSEGYIKGNVRVISWRANKIKSDATIEELEAILLYMKNKIS